MLAIMADKVFVGKIIHTKSLNEIEIFTNGYIAINDGKITNIGSDFNKWKQSNQDGFIEKQLNLNQFLIPGFIDCHIHAPQIPNIGLGLDKPLLDWLESYTFPLEAQYEDQIFAQSVYEHVVRSTIKNGTTFACYFATNHKDSSVLLAKEVVKQGQRAFVGKVCADSLCPDYYIEDTDQSLKYTEDFIKEIVNLKNDLVQPIITPRFALSCSEKLLTGLGDLAKQNDLCIQSHISENLYEIELVQKRFGKLYAQVYRDANLLTNKTIMAHGVYLEDEELEIFRKTGACIAHCPASNTMLSSGLCDVKRLLNANIKVGLGTDISGGNSYSIKDAILHCLQVSLHISFLKGKKFKTNADIVSSIKDETPLNYKQALYLATLGGAEALSIQDKVGNFDIGKQFDALIIDTDVYPTENITFPQKLLESKSDEDKLMELLQKFIYVGDDRNIIEVYVNGKQIK